MLQDWQPWEGLAKESNVHRRTLRKKHGRVEWVMAAEVVKQKVKNRLTLLEFTEFLNFSYSSNFASTDHNLGNKRKLNLLFLSKWEDVRGTKNQLQTSAKLCWPNHCWKLNDTIPQWTELWWGGGGIQRYKNPQLCTVEVVNRTNFWHALYMSMIMFSWIANNYISAEDDLVNRPPLKNYKADAHCGVLLLTTDPQIMTAQYLITTVCFAEVR